MKLNPQQAKAVTHINSPLLIIAGAGTGKTTVLTKRIEYLIKQHKVDPHSIFATAFTEKNAQEMIARLDLIMPLSYEEPWIGTFHSLCDRILRYEGLEFGFDPNFQIMTHTQQWLFLKEHLFDFDLDYYRPLGNPNKFINAFITFFSRLQDENIDPEEFDHFARTQYEQASDHAKEQEGRRLVELAHAFSRYRDLKTQASVLDFGDLIIQTIKLFKTRPNILKKYQNKFKHILVDEFQDTNYAQFQLIQLIAPPNQNPSLVVVGDDDQAIYKFRGASISNILQFKQLYPNSKELVLKINYRSHQKILDHAYQSITSNNPDRLEVKLSLSKKLKAKTQIYEQTPSPLHVHLKTLDEEITWTIQQLISLHTDERIAYGQMAILARSNAQLEAYLPLLKKSGLPYQLVANKGLFDCEEVAHLIDLCKCLVDETDDQALLSVLQMPLYHTKNSVLLNLLNQAKKNHQSLWSILINQPENTFQSQTLNAIGTIRHLRERALSTPVFDLLYQYVLDSGYLKQYTNFDSLKNQLALKNLNLFFTKIRHYERLLPTNNLPSFVDMLNSWLEAGENPGQAQIEDVDTITLLTVHAAKGLEFDVVFVGSLVAGRFPSSHRKDPIEIPDSLTKEILPTGNAHLAEERRLFYVAMTRAKRYLFLTSAADYGGRKQWRPSGFIEESGIPSNNLSLSSNHIIENQSEVGEQVLKDMDLSNFSANFVISKLSYSQIETFHKCPLQYKFRYLLKIPTKSKAALSYGQTIHQTLYQFHQLEGARLRPNLDKLIQLYEKNFIDEGYDSLSYRQARYDQGKRDLKRYFHAYQQKLEKPILLEQPFRLQLDGLEIVGKIDRIDKLSDGSLEIIDYKTGSEKTQKQVDADPQLSLYHLAATESLQLNISRLSLYFLETGNKISTTRSSKDIDKTKQKLLNSIEQIRSSTFKPKPGSPMPCEFCDYKQICPVYKKG